MDQQPLMEEKTAYATLLTRKNRAMKGWESGVFLFGFGIIFLMFEFRSPAMVTAAVLLAILVFALVPFCFWVILRPHYVLYSDRLTVKMGQKQANYALSEMEKDFGLSYVYLVQGKRIFLLASDAFLNRLNAQLEVIRRGIK